MIKHLTDAECKRITSVPLVWSQGRDAAIISFLLNTGLRVGEFCSLRWDDVTNDCVTVRAETSKTGVERIVPLNQKAKTSLNILLKFSPGDSDRIIQLSVRRIQQLVRYWGVKANMPFSLTPHKLRHTFATSLVSRGVSTRVIQALLGHSSLSSTQIYAGVTRDSLFSAVQLL
jgi:integrase/recombinase XerD